MRSSSNIPEANREKIIYRVTWVGFFLNLILSAGKLAAGIIGHSGAMVADAVHSLSDFATDVVVLLFVRISSKPKDENHDYGHGKFETLATVIIGLALTAVGFKIFLDSIQSILSVVRGAILPRPGLIAFIAAAVSIAAKEALYRYTVFNAKKANSSAVLANAWHHRSDALSSIGTLIGIGGALALGEKWSILDPLAAFVVSIFIIKVAIELIAPGLNELMEKSLPKETEDEILQVIAGHAEIQDPHNLKTRRIGASIAIEIHIRLDALMSVQKSHAITRALEEDLCGKFGSGTHIMIHVEPKNREPVTEMQK